MSMQTQGLCKRVHTTHSISVQGDNVGQPTGGTKVYTIVEKPFAVGACAPGSNATLSADSGEHDSGEGAAQ